MSINKHSILNAISLFFFLIFTLINALFWVAFEYTKKSSEEECLRRFFLAQKVIRERDEATLKHLMIRRSLVSSATLLEKGKIIIELPFAKMLKYNGKTFFIQLPPPKPPPDFRETEVLEDILERDSFLLIIVVAGIDMLILIFFIYIQ